MKKIILSILTILTMLTSCEQQEMILSESQKTSKVKKQEILTFPTQEAFDSTITKVNSMTEQERYNWERNMGFSSFGSITDEFYSHIDFNKYKSIDEIRAIDPEENMLNIYSCNGENYIEPSEMNSIEKYIMNKDRMFIIGNKAFKIVNSEMISTDTVKIEELKRINSVEEFKVALKQNTKTKVQKAISYFDETREVENGNYKTKLYYQTENFWDINSNTLRENEFTVSNYKKGLLGYYAYTLPTTFNIELTSTDAITWKDCNTRVGATGMNIKSYPHSDKIFIQSGWSNMYNPYFCYKKVNISTAAGTISF